MSVSAGATVVRQFPLYDPANVGVLAAPDALPTGVLSVDGVDSAAVVTITNLATGRYRFSVDIPAGLATNQGLEVRIACVFSAVTYVGEVWSDTIGPIVVPVTSGTVSSGDPLANLRSAYIRATANLNDLLANPKPSYTVDGRTYNWKEYQEMLFAQLRGLKELIGDEAGPFEVLSFAE